MDYSALCSEIASRARGMSGREIAKLGVAWQAAGYAAEDGTLTRDMILEKVDEAVRSHSQKVRWLSEEEKRDSRDIDVGVEYETKKSQLGKTKTQS